MRRFGVLILWMLSFTLFISSCSSDEQDSEFKADFTYEFGQDQNHVLFTNTSQGEYYSLLWDFGNDETELSSNKTKSFEIYYPLAGEYTVTLTCKTSEGASSVASKVVTISNTDLEVSFTAQIDGENTNIVKLTNTSEGNFDSFVWKYRHKEIEGEAELEAYFPYSGIYDIELQLKKGNDIFSSSKSVTIAQDDANYPENMTLSWSDNFDGSSVNSNEWNFETGASGWGNQELQNYTDGDNAQVNDGTLKIVARKLNDNMVAGSYTSTRMTSKKNFLYGRMEARLKLPSGRGVWPAFWMLGSNISSVSWPACGEIDIMEYVGYEPNVVHSSLHTPSSYGNTVNTKSYSLETAEEEFNVYGVIWTEKDMKFYIDEPENIFYTYAPSNKNDDNWPYNKPQFFILNLAVGGTWGGAQGIDNSIFPQTYEIDYVKVYQEPY